jgi:hypothetical protein
MTDQQIEEHMLSIHICQTQTRSLNLCLRTEIGNTDRKRDAGTYLQRTSENQTGGDGWTVF